MKKNLLQIITLALVLINLVFSVLIVFTLVPENKKVNQLITDIASAIDLDLTDDVSGNYNSNLTTSIDNLAVYTISDSFTINLAVGDDGSSSHVAVLTIGIDMDKSSEGYEDYGSDEAMSAKETLIKSTLISTIGSFSYEEFLADEQAVKDACTEALQSLFNSNFIVGVEFSSKVLQ